jgi:predicted ATPase
VLVLLERLTDPALVAAEIAETLARRDGTDGLGADGLAGYLRERELLLAIDNFEHLVPAALLVSELLELSPRTRVLVSSRTALCLRGEHTFQLEPLELPAAGADAASSPAVELFIQCALAARRKLSLNPEVVGAIAETCRALDGLPLAIELAASRCRSLTPAEIAGQLTKPLVIGERGLRDLPDRQQTLEATIRWSYDLLTPAAREVLGAASAFLGGFDREALAAVAGRPAVAELDELLEASLARRDPDWARYELLELVRAFALERLEASGQAPAARTAHRRHFAALVAPASDGFEAGDPLDELAGPLLADHANLRVAFEDALAAGDLEDAVGLALGLRPVWFAGMLRHESQELVERLLARFQIAPEHELALLTVVAHIELSTANTSGWSARLAARADALDDLEAFVLATCNLFGHALNAGDRDQLERLTPELLALIKPGTSPRGLGWIHYFLAVADYLESRLDQASERASRSAEIAAAIGHDFMLASAVVLRLLAQSASDRAIEQPALAAALQLVHRPKLKPLVAVALWLVARYAAGIDSGAARRWLAYGERIHAELDVRIWETAVRDETMAALGIDDLAPVLAATPPLDHSAALAQAVAWVAERDPAERSPRSTLATIGPR